MTSQDALTDTLAFVRVSTGSQDESTQITTLTKHAPDHGLNIVETWRLHGYSASKGEQDEDLTPRYRGHRAGSLADYLRHRLLTAGP